MSLAPVAAVESRIAEIQQQIQSLSRIPKGDFSAALQRADASRVHSETYRSQSAPGVAGEWAQRLPEAGKQWAGAIETAASNAGVDPRLLAALTWAESGFRADAKSHAGATGLTQLMPGTAAGLGVDANDPVANLDGGARYLRAQIDRFGSVELALAAYNAGPGRVAQAGGIPSIAETRAYVPRVLGYYAQLGGNR